MILGSFVLKHSFVFLWKDGSCRNEHIFDVLIT